MSKAKDLLSQSWIIILSGFLALVNLKVDQIMLRWMSGAAEVGIYSVAVTFSEVWYFIPAAIAMSVFPRLIELKKSQPSIYDKRLQQICDLFFALAFLVALSMTFVAGPLIPFLYTNAYAGASAILVIHIWSGIFIFMRALFSKWMFIEDALMFSLVSHGFGAIVNVLLNIILIPKFGGQGAALATLFSYAASSYFALFFYAKTRPLALIMSKSLILPFRLIIYRGETWA
jgi:O-antigen/teichoic acid export membrane protein